MADTPVPKYGTNESGEDVNLLANNTANGETQQNSISKLVASFAGIAHVISRSDTPSSTDESDVFMVGASPSGAFAGFTTDNLAIRIDAAWHELAPFDGLAIVREDLGNSVHVYDGSNWLEAPASVQDSISASTTQSQGQEPLTRRFNRVSTVTSNGDVVTLPTAAAGLQVVVWNDDQSGTNSLQVFPASGDSIDEAAADASVTLAHGVVAHFFAINATEWCSIQQ